MCGFCNLSERSCLGQGEMVRFKTTLNVDKIEKTKTSSSSPSPSPDLSDKSPKNNLNRRKTTAAGGGGGGGSRKVTASGDPIEPNDELENIGYIEEPEINLLFETTGS